MKVTLEQIDLLRKRANVGYKDAKEALEMFEGDIVEALAYLEEQKKIKTGCMDNCDVFQKGKNIVSKGNKIKLVISKNDSILINIPLTFVIIFAVIAMPIFIGAMVVTVVTGCKIRFKKENGEDCAINNHIEKVSDVVSSAAQKVTEDIKNV